MCDSIIKPVKYDVYLDMDGCICNFADPALRMMNAHLFDDYDFGGELQRLINNLKKDLGGSKVLFEHIEVEPKGLNSARALMMRLIKNNKYFWECLRWKVHGKRLWRTIRYHNPIILSKPPDNAAVKGKLAWIISNLDPVPTKLIFEPQKHIYASPTSILIDDFEENIKAWEEHGGIGVLYDEKKIDSVIDILRNLLEEP